MYQSGLLTFLDYSKIEKFIIFTKLKKCRNFSWTRDHKKVSLSLGNRKGGKWEWKTNFGEKEKNYEISSISLSTVQLISEPGKREVNYNWMKTQRTGVLFDIDWILFKTYYFSFFSAMLEPTPRYPPSVGGPRLQIDTSSLDTAVDLSRYTFDLLSHWL